MNQKEHSIRAVALRVFTSREGSRGELCAINTKNFKLFITDGKYQKNSKKYID